MSVITLQLTAHDPIIARDGRPFGIGQGNRMRGLGWPLPSVVAGSFRTALVKSHPDLDFDGDMPRQLMAVEVAGVFPTGNEEGTHQMYLPAPNDCSWDEKTKKVHRARPILLEQGEGIDFPEEAAALRPVRLTQEQAEDDFKAKPIPAWWPMKKYVEWLVDSKIEYVPEWFDTTFLAAAKSESRDHVCLDTHTGAAAEGQLFTTAGLNATHLPRFYAKDLPSEQKQKSFTDRFARITLAARVTIPGSGFEHIGQLNTWHPLGGERRLVHWQRSDTGDLWKCPETVKSALQTATRIRMVLATPAIFTGGWKPGWVSDQLEGTPPGTNIKLKLVGVSNGRWKAVSGWSLAKINNKGELDPNGKPGPKPIRRMVPAGSVYFFEVKPGEAAALADQWLKSVSDGEQEPRDGFGLAVWGTW